jgi:hypothetical protein
MRGICVVGVVLAIASASGSGAQAAEELVQVGSQTADDEGSGWICIQADSNAGFAGLKKIVADNVQLSNGAQVNDVWVTMQVVAVEFTEAKGSPVEAMMPAEAASRNGLHPCPGLIVAAVGGAGAAALGGALAYIALNGDGVTRPPVTGRPVPPGRPPPGLPPPGLPPGPPSGVPPGPPTGLPPVSPSL